MKTKKEMLEAGIAPKGHKLVEVQRETTEGDEPTSPPTG